MITFDRQELEEIIQAVSSATNTDAMPAHSWARAANVLLAEVERLRKHTQYFLNVLDDLDNRGLLGVVDDYGGDADGIRFVMTEARRALEGKEVEE